MRVYTRQDLADLAPARYAAVYDSGKHGKSHQVISIDLKLLSYPIDPDRVDRIIGNGGWTHGICDECQAICDGFVAIGSGYSCINLCFDCARKIQSMLPTDTHPAIASQLDDLAAPDDL